MGYRIDSTRRAAASPRVCRAAGLCACAAGRRARGCFSAFRAASMRQVSVQAERDGGASRADCGGISCAAAAASHHVRTSQLCTDSENCFWPYWRCAAVSGSADTRVSGRSPQAGRSGWRGVTGGLEIAANPSKCVWLPPPLVTQHRLASGHFDRREYTSNPGY